MHHFFHKHFKLLWQEQTDSAPTFVEVLEKMEKWMKHHHLGSGKKFAIVTDGSEFEYCAHFVSLQKCLHRSLGSHTHTQYTHCFIYVVCDKIDSMALCPQMTMVLLHDVENFLKYWHLQLHCA